MARKIALSDKTKQLMTKLTKMKSLPHALIAAERESVIEQAELVNFLKEREQGDKKNEFLLESLSASLLKDLHNTLLNKQEQRRKKKEGDWSNKLKYWLLAIAGIIFFGCEGFDGITAMLEVFTLTPVAILTTGFAFSLLAITVFCAFDLVEIAKNLGIKNKNAPQLLDIYLKETKLIGELISQIQKKMLSDLLLGRITVKDLQESLSLVQMLKAKYEALGAARETMEKLGSRPALQAAKSITASVAGIIFFSGGFFAGQTVALKIAELCFTAVTSGFPPIVLISLLVGAAAFGVYWYVERPGIENLISSYVGLDQEKIDEFCDKEKVNERTSNLARLESELQEAIRNREIPPVPQRVARLEDSMPLVSQARVLPVANMEIGFSDSRHIFYPAAEPRSEMRRAASDTNLIGIPKLVPEGSVVTL